MITETIHGPYIIYNLFPRLLGFISGWKNHIERIASMGFNWIYINPFHYPGFSGSLYAVKDYFGFHPLMYDEQSGISPYNDLKDFIQLANKHGIQVMADLVINHTAVDSELTKTHPEWYQYENGKIKNPCAKDGDRVVAVWGDLAEIDNLKSPDRDNLWQFWLKVTDYLLDLGFNGFRCDAAYQVPAELWRFIIPHVKQRRGQTLFFGETLGCDPEDTMELIDAGFDVIFNSSKYWDFTEPWCMEQYHMTRTLVPSISFPESHDTERLYHEEKGNERKIKSRYLFAAVFSGGVMVPIGFEYGFSKKVDVVHTTPNDWEDTRFDLSSFIRECNAIKKRCPLLWLDSNASPAELSNPHLFALKKWTDTERAVFLLNKTGYHGQRFCSSMLGDFFTGFTVSDITPEQPERVLSDRFEYTLEPNESKLLYAFKR
ncbi:alpha-amylase [bacterium]|nr:alpha-amylase [bacterium]